MPRFELRIIHYLFCTSLSLEQLESSIVWEHIKTATKPLDPVFICAWQYHLVACNEQETLSWSRALQRASRKHPNPSTSWDVLKTHIISTLGKMSAQNGIFAVNHGLSAWTNNVKGSLETEISNACLGSLSRWILLNKSLEIWVSLLSHRKLCPKRHHGSELWHLALQNKQKIISRETPF